MKSVLIIAFTSLCFINCFAQDVSSKTSSVSVLSVINPTSTIIDSNSRSQNQSQFSNTSDTNQSGDLRQIQKEINIPEPQIIDSDNKSRAKKKVN